MASQPRHDQDTLAPPPTRERPSRLIDIAVALLFLIADAVIVAVAAMLFVMVGMGSAQSSHRSAAAHSRDVPVLTWLVVWGIPAVAVTGAVVHARLRMPVTAVVQSLFALACVLLAVIWTRMLLS
jgi:heme/copper-type cytochrome/quinol oxidase subunit 2